MSQALVVIDVQKAFEHPSWGKRNNPQAEENIKQVIARWRALNFSILHIQHVSDNPTSLFYKESELVDFKEAAKPLSHEPIFQKQVNSAFIGTELESYLRSHGIENLVIVGLTTPHCVSTSTRMSGNLGFETILLSDATACFELTDQHGVVYDAETIHNTTLATLHHEFAEVMTTKELFG